jgi:hypothetical protein
MKPITTRRPRPSAKRVIGFADRILIALHGTIEKARSGRWKNWFARSFAYGFRADRGLKGLKTGTPVGSKSETSGRHGEAVFERSRGDGKVDSRIEIGCARAGAFDSAEA